jgi:hypothetical protein
MPYNLAPSLHRSCEIPRVDLHSMEGRKGMCLLLIEFTDNTVCARAWTESFTPPLFFLCGWLLPSCRINSKLEHQGAHGYIRVVSFLAHTSAATICPTKNTRLPFVLGKMAAAQVWVRNETNTNLGLSFMCSCTSSPKCLLLSSNSLSLHTSTIWSKKKRLSREGEWI